MVSELFWQIIRLAHVGISVACSKNNNRFTYCWLFSYSYLCLSIMPSVLPPWADGPMPRLGSCKQMHWCNYMYLLELARFEKEMPTARVWPHGSRWPHAQVWISRTDASRHLVSAYTALHNLRINLHVVRPPPLFINGQISPIRRHAASVIEVSWQLLHLTTCAPLQPAHRP